MDKSRQGRLNPVGETSAVATRFMPAANEPCTWSAGLLSNVPPGQTV